MKVLEFETSKGSFLVVDAINNANIHTGTKLLEITEEQASEIVSSLVKDDNGNKSYIHTLHSLLKSKGIHLYNNPLQTAYQFDQSVYEYHQAEQKTFYNPYIFKL